MYKCVKLKNKNINHMLSLNASRLAFNSLNDDFEEGYYKESFIRKLVIKYGIKLIKDKTDYIAYIWLQNKSSKYVTIKAINIIESVNKLAVLSYLISKLKSNHIYVYNCEKNHFNTTLLDQSGFTNESGTIELIREIEEQELVNINENISFESFIKGTHEVIRCKLQNEIFNSNFREPLTVEDIYYDEMQNYYLDYGCVFIKFHDNYIGYGQIIKDGSIPTIVNFGLINHYRNKGLGKVFLKYLISILFEKGYTSVRIKVDSNNTHALRLYMNLGFIIVKEYEKWILEL
jgi:Acetyltransferases